MRTLAALVVVAALVGCHSSSSPSAAPGASASAPAAPSSAPREGPARFSRPIAAAHAPGGGTFVAGLVVPRGAVAVTALAADGTTRCHIIGPVLRTGFPAVVHHIAQSLLADQVRANRRLVAVQVCVHVLLHVPAVHLVHFKTGSLGGCRVVSDAQQRVPESKHDPVSRRWRPVECSIGMHLCCQVNDFALCDGVRGRDIGRGQRVEIRVSHEGRFLLKSIHASP